MRKCLLVLCLVVLVVQTSFAKTTIKGVRVWPSPDNVRVVFDLSDSIGYQVSTATNPSRIFIDIDKASFKVSLKQLNLDKTGIKSITTQSLNHRRDRVTLELEKYYSPKVFSLKPNQHYGHRLVVDLDSPEKQSILALFDNGYSAVSQPESKKRVISTNQRQFVVAIDAGHGGDDPGAIGKKGTREKDVVLSIAKYLKYELDKEPHIKAFLIRSGDYYISLNERVMRARQRPTDLFLSIHADAFNSPTAIGASVFTISSRGASSAAAKWLAESENRADLVGGVSLGGKSEMLASVLLDLSQSASKQASLDAANMILKSMKKVTPLHRGEVESAGFAVLKAPDVPSMLIETGFISHQPTEAKLRTKRYQMELAKSITQGVKEYFKHRPLHSIEPIKQPQWVKYKVKKGDSLSLIAHRFKLSIANLKEMNRLKNDTLQIGQSLRIPKS